MHVEIYILATNHPLKSIDSFDMYIECCQSNSSLRPSDFFYFLGVKRDKYSKTKVPLFVYQLSHDSIFAPEQIVNREEDSFVIETVLESHQEKFKLSFSTAIEKHLILKTLSAVNSILGSIIMPISEPNETNNAIIKLKYFEPNTNGTVNNASLNSAPTKTEYPYLKNDFHLGKCNFVMQPFSFITSSDIKSNMTSDYMILLFSQMIREKVKMENMEHISRRRSSLREGTLGFKCVHCLGIERGLYFPTTLKALQGIPTLLCKYNLFGDGFRDTLLVTESTHFHLKSDKHFMTCQKCPQMLKDTLVRSKKYHRKQISLVNSQITFFSNIYNRVRDVSFDGGSFADREFIHKYILKLCETYSRKDLETDESVPSMISFSMDSPRQVFGTPCTPNEHDWFAITPFIGENDSCAMQWDSECIMQLQEMIEGDKDYEEMIDILLND
jgi:hypothetical protein